MQHVYLVRQMYKTKFGHLHEIIQLYYVVTYYLEPGSAIDLYSMLHFFTIKISNMLNEEFTTYTLHLVKIEISYEFFLMWCIDMCLHKQVTTLPMQIILGRN